MLRLGANDPDFNLRNETVFLIREKEQKNHTFATSIETHGDYDVVMETSNNLTSSCEEVKVVMDTAEYTVIKAIYKGGHSVTLCLANAEDSKKNKHHLSVEERITTGTVVAEFLPNENKPLIDRKYENM